MHGYSQRDLARMLRMKSSTLISQWEKGITLPTLDTLLKLCVVYNTLIEELYFERLQEHRNELLLPGNRACIINQEKAQIKNI